jgi:hypothetical protein
MADDALLSDFLEVCAQANYTEAYKRGDMPSNMPQDYAQVPPVIKYHARENMLKVIGPAWPLVSAALDDKERMGIEQAAVLRGRIELFISELQGRGKGIIAAELQVIIDTPMED